MEVIVKTTNLSAYHPDTKQAFIFDCDVVSVSISTEIRRVPFSFGVLSSGEVELLPLLVGLGEITC